MIEVLHLPVSASLPVFVCSLTPIKDQLILARQGIDEVREKHPDSTPSNVKAVYMSPWHSHKMTDKFDPLCASVTTIATWASQTHLSANLPALNMGLIVTDCWGIQYDRSDHTILHNHFPADFSCVIYLEVDENSAPIVFDGGMKVQPKPDMLVLFPGILNHQVPATEGKRIVVAMNLNKRATFEMAAFNPPKSPELELTKSI